MFFLEIDPAKDHGRSRQKEQQRSGKAGLKFSVHGLGRGRRGVANPATPLTLKQLHCHCPRLIR
jgi:hypothetical protein